MQTTLSKSEIRQKINDNLTRLHLETEKLQEYQAEKDDLKERLEHLEKAQAIMQQAAKLSQQHLADHLSSIVTQAIQAAAEAGVAMYQFEDMEGWLKKCLSIAQKNELIIFENRALKEIKTFSQQKERIETLIEQDKFISGDEKDRRMKEYMLEAFKIIEDAKEDS